MHSQWKYTAVPRIVPELHSHCTNLCPTVSQATQVNVLVKSENKPAALPAATVITIDWSAAFFLKVATSEPVPDCAVPVRRYAQRKVQLEPITLFWLTSVALGTHPSGEIYVVVLAPTLVHLLHHTYADTGDLKVNVIIQSIGKFSRLQQCTTLKDK